jgi:hypothetical protein
VAHETFCGYCCGFQPMYQVQYHLFDQQQVRQCSGLADYQGRCQAFDETAWLLHALCEQLLSVGRRAYRHGLVMTALDWLDRGYSPPEVAALAQQGIFDPFAVPVKCTERQRTIDGDRRHGVVDLTS